MFTDNIEPIIYNVVATIGRKCIILKDIVTVIWYWTDDEEKLHTNKFNKVLYLPEPPVNIISATTLAEYTKDDEGT